MKLESDVIIIGAGPVGCVLAHKIAKELKLNCLILEKRNHIAGNCYDEYNSKGLLYHKYGPHYLRFKNQKTLNFLSKFTKWIDGNYIVKTVVKNKLYPIPINLDTLELFFKKKFKSKKDVIKFINKKRIKYKNPKNFEQFVLSKLGREIYENFYKNYTIKQWGIDPKKLSKNIAGRLPIRFNRNPYYTKEKLRFMPKHGFTKMFNKMIDDKRITIKLNCDYFKIRKNLKYKHFMIYTGEPDKYFNYKYGKLDWRSLIFKFKNLKMKNYQTIINRYSAKVSQTLHLISAHYDQTPALVELHRYINLNSAALSGVPLWSCNLTNRYFFLGIKTLEDLKTIIHGFQKNQMELQPLVEK